MDQETFRENMAYLSAAYDKALSKERLAVYWNQLGGLRDDLFTDCIRQLVNNHRHFPFVADVREYYRAQLRNETLNSMKSLAHNKPTDRSKVTAMVKQLRESLR